MMVTRNTLQDSVSFLQYGQRRIEDKFYTYELGLMQPSSWIAFPSKDNPYGKFKYVSAEINMQADARIITR